MRSGRRASRTRPRAALALTAAALAVALAGLGLISASAPVGAGVPSGPHPPGGPAWVVSLGDSYIAGAAGRWAGNTHAYATSQIDALGPSAYADTGTSTDTAAHPPVASCRRSTSAEIHLGGVRSLNLACSGARTSTSPYAGGDFTPGVDRYHDGRGHDGQVRQLQEFARTHRVRMVAVSVVGDDFGFSSIVQDCVRDYLLSTIVWRNYCHDDASVRSRFEPAAVAARAADLTRSLSDIRTAMADAGYSAGDYGVVAQTYPSPVPSGSGLRYPEFAKTRQTIGGCGFWNADLTWANRTALPAINSAVTGAVKASGLANAHVLDVSRLFEDHRLCEKGTRKLYEQDRSNWRAEAAVDRSEWVANIRTVTASAGPLAIAESLHPDYWGQLALRNCLRQAYSGGAVRGGQCITVDPGRNGSGEPNTRLLNPDR